MQILGHYGNVSLQHKTVYHNDIDGLRPNLFKMYFV